MTTVFDIESMNATSTRTDNECEQEESNFRESLISDGLSKIKDGTIADDEGKTEIAIQHFLEATEYLLQGISGICETNSKEEIRRKIIYCIERADKLLPHQDSQISHIESASATCEEQSEDIDSSVLVSQILQEFHVVEEDDNAPETPKFNFNGCLIEEGHTEYDFVRQMVLGLENALSHPSTPTTEVTPADFTSSLTYASKPIEPDSNENDRLCVTREVAPKIFASIRHKFGIQEEDFKNSLCQSKSLFQLKSPGKSSSFFYISPDFRYFIKTISVSEADFLVMVLQNYYNYLMQNPNTLLTKFFGLFATRDVYGTLNYFVIMENVFPPNYPVDLCYDLKGSTRGRCATIKDHLRGNFILKDLDVIKGEFKILSSDRKQLLQQLDQDTMFLEANTIMDYSLLVGVHQINKDKHPYEKMENRTNMFQKDYGGLISEDSTKIYFFGVIDILTPYTWMKMMESKWKTLFSDEIAISAVNPTLYRKRFLHFMSTHCLQKKNLKSPCCK